MLFFFLFFQRSNFPIHFFWLFKCWNNFPKCFFRNQIITCITSRGTTVKDAFGDDLPDSINLYDKSNVLKKNIDPSTYKFLSPVMDITFDSVTPTADDPVRVTFVANNMTDNIQVDILYYCPEHGWEVLQGEKISDNQVAAYFHAGSSVMALIYREKGATVGTSQVSPQTGARSTWPIAVSAIFFVSFGIFALYKSKKA